MSVIDTTDKKRESVCGRYLVTSKASKLWFIPRSSRYMQLLIDKSTGGNDRSYIIECDGDLAVLNTNEIEIMRVGDFESFDVKILQ